jgi:hypothetical protein
MNENEIVEIIISAFAETNPNVSENEIREIFQKKQDEDSLKIKAGMILAVKRYAERNSVQVCPRCGLHLTPKILT